MPCHICIGLGRSRSGLKPDPSWEGESWEPSAPAWTWKELHLCRALTRAHALAWVPTLCCFNLAAWPLNEAAPALQVAPGLVGRAGSCDIGAMQTEPQK